MPPTFTPDIQPTLLKNPSQIHSDYVYGAITLYGQKSFQYYFNFSKTDPQLRSINHIFHSSLRGIQFVLSRFRSTLLTASLIAFFSSAY